MSSLEGTILKIEVLENNFNNLTKGERDALHNLKNDKTTVIKGPDKGSAVALWDREDYNEEAKNQPEDTNIYKEVPNDAKNSYKDPT